MERQRHLMIVDDDEDDRNLFIEAFKEIAPDKIITYAQDGIHLVEQLEFIEPDVIFLDLNMPRKNGLESLRELRCSDKYANLPVLIYSTAADHAHIDSTYKLGANLYIQKPVSYQDIKKIIRKLLAIKLDDICPQPPRNKFLLK
jgi:DNA-binding NarL/FixJ family response regulator